MKAIEVIIDPGHGGRDWGCNTEGKPNRGYMGALEKDINLEVAVRLGWYLAQNDISYMLTRYGDRYVGLKERSKQANDAQARLFLSIHCNYAGDPDIKGLEVWHHHKSEKGVVLAQKFCEGLCDLNYTRNRGVKSANPSFSVLHYTSMPAILLELGFISNREDCLCLYDESKQALIAERLKNIIKDNI